VRVAVRLTPRAGADRIEGIAAPRDGGSVLKVSVTAPPAGNRANEALIALLAKEWRVPRRDIAIAVGSKSRNKLVHIAGEPRALLQRLAAALAALPAA
jgi:uncharacterized protein